MSEKSKGDTSRVVNNPLLSASVTGLTFDDFPSAPLLLPAAPPIERSPPPVLDLNSDSKEPSYGQGADGDSVFSEINLNATTDEDFTNQPNSTSFISPLEETAIVQDSSLLSQAASSFSQLPTVASTVFSTFSKVIKDYTPASQSSEDSGAVISAPPQVLPTAYDQFYAPEQQEYNRSTPIGASDPPPQEPPKFYSPTEIPTIPSAANTQQTNQNTYRLSAKKKTYAQIPGLSSNPHQPAAANLFSTSDPTLSPPPPPLPAQSLTPQVPVDYEQNSGYSDFAIRSGPVFNLQPAVSDIQQSYSEPQVKKEERRGLFSFTNVVAPVLQNLSGFVGGRGTDQGNQTVRSSVYPDSGQAFTVTSGEHPPPQASPTQYITGFDIPVADSEQSSKPNPIFIGGQNTQQPYLSGVSAGQPNVPLTGPSYPLADQFQTPIAVVPPIPTFFAPTNSAGPINPPNLAPSPSAPPLSASSTPPLVATPNLNLSGAPPNSGIHHAPPHSAGNNFRLQKGTRHYRPPLEIPTNPAPPSNLLQPLVNSNQEPVEQQSFVQFKPLATANATLSSSKPTQNPSYPQNNPIEVAKPPISTAVFPQPPNSATTYPQPQFSAPPTSSVVCQDINKASLSLIANSQPVVDSVPAQPDNLQSFFSNSPTVSHGPYHFGFSEIGWSIPDAVASTVAPSSKIEHISQVHGVIEPERKFSVDIDASNTPEKFETTVAKSASENLSSVSAVDKTATEAAELSELTDNLSIGETQGRYTDLPLEIIEKSVTPPIKVNELLPENVINVNQTTSDEEELTAANIIEPDYKIDPEAIVSIEKPQLPINIGSSANVFSLNNYFSASNTTEAAHFKKLPITDLNANKPAPIITPKPEVAIPPQEQVGAFNFFGPSYQVEGSKKNKPVLNLPDPLSFFDSFQPVVASSTSILGQIDENSNTGADINARSDIQIQNFFNNPPQTPNPTASDLNYKLVASNLIKKKYSDNLSSTSRPISPLSNVVEPPSSACSEFSADSSVQSTVNLSKLINADIPDGLNAETTESEQLDPEVMALLGTSKNSNTVYQPAVKHWFYKKKVDEKYIWTPFSHHDSALIETHFSDPTASKIVPVEGGRYDVNIPERLRLPIFWSGDATEVRRCSWFYKAVDSRYVPYEEAIADKLEIEYEEAMKTNEWHRKIPLPTGETVVFHGATLLVQFLQAASSDSWGASTQTTSRPRIVKRDLEDFNIETGESNKVDHLLFMVHGIGSVCDLKFRTVEEVVDEFRNIATQLIQSHYKNSCETGRVGRVEVLPVSWHSELHSEESGVDEKLKAITLESIPKLRNFTNDTLLDILFYTSPVFCQNIMDTVAGTMNKVYAKYCQRNPSFSGGVSLAGHSLGSLILFDLLCHQKPVDTTYMQNSENPDQPITPLQIRAQTPNDEESMTSKQISYTIGSAGTGQAYISYPQLVFQPKKFFALGSPIGMFVTIRGIDRLGLEFILPTCPGFFNIFHPYDPVAYRIEALVNSELSTARPVLVPHHKGRKRMHLELKETMTRVGADIKQRIVDTFKNTFGTVYQLTAKQKTTPDPTEIEREVDKVLEMQLKMDKEPRSRANSNSTQSDVDTGEVDLPLGRLNEGKRIDYVLQEAPLEFFNEYLFALTSHVCYWESADTILFLMKEIYSSLGIQTDSQVPQQSMTIERPLANSPHPSLNSYDHSEHMEYNNQ